MESNNGYDLLWRILELTIPGLDPTFPIKIPTWSDDGIFNFAHAFQLYYCLLSKQGDFHDDKMRSTMFLQAINDYAFANLITTILTCTSITISPWMMTATCPGPYASWVSHTSSTKPPSSAPSRSSREPTAWVVRRMHGRLMSPSKAPHMFFRWTLEDVTTHLLATAAMDVTTVEAAVSNLAPSPPAVTIMALARRPSSRAFRPP